MINILKFLFLSRYFHILNIGSNRCVLRSYQEDICCHCYFYIELMPGNISHWFMIATYYLGIIEKANRKLFVLDFHIFYKIINFQERFLDNKYILIRKYLE